MVPSTTKDKGISLIEVVIAIAIFAIFTLGVFFLSLDTLQRDSKIELEKISLDYAQEGIEAIRNMRDREFLAITNGDHGLQFQNDTWSFIAAPESIDSTFDRTITVEDVYRDVSGNIAGSGTFDPETKKVTSEVSWNLRGVIPRTSSITVYVSNWTGDDWIETTCTEFGQGTVDATETVTTTSPPSDNCSLEITDIQSPSSFFSSVNIGSHANDVIVEGNYAYAAVASTQKGLAIIDVFDAENPVITSELYVWKKGNALVKDGNMVYMGIEAKNPAIAMIDVSNPLSPAATHAWELDGYGGKPAVSNNYLYTAAKSSNNGLSMYSIPNIPFATDFLSLATGVHTIEIDGNYAYLGVDADSSGLRVVDISVPTNINQIASLDVGEEVNAIVINGFIAYLGTEDSNNSLQVVNISDPANPTLINSLNIGGEIQDLVIQGNLMYAAVDNQNAGMAAINISNPLAPTLAYNLDIQGKGTGIDADANYIYVSSDTANKGVVIIGATQSGAATGGSYTSQIFDTGSTTTRYNFIEWDHIEVPGGTITFQIKTASSSSGLATATWVGSDGTNGNYYENSRTPIVLDPAGSGARYFQYKAYFTSDGVTSPSLNSVRVNYNP